MSVSYDQIVIRQVANKSDLKAFVELPYRLYASDPNWVPPLRNEVYDLLTPGKNPWFEHGRMQLFIAEAGGRCVGRISAHIDDLAQTRSADIGLGPGTGNWGLFEAETPAIATDLFAAAENWLRREGMTRALGPISLSIWDEPGLLVEGHDHPPTAMMGYQSAAHEGWVAAAGYHEVKALNTWQLDISKPFPPLIQRIIASGARNPRIRIRPVDKSKFTDEAKIILGILNNAWDNNWGTVPLTDNEVAYVGKKLKQIVFEDLIMIAELDNVPVAFMITIPDINEQLINMGGSLWPFNWAKLLWWLRAPRVTTMRVPLMGVVKSLQASRMASQLAFMMIETIRANSHRNYGATRGEIGWILDDNQGMNAIAEAIDSHINKSYKIYEKALV